MDRIITNNPIIFVIIFFGIIIIAFVIYKASILVAIKKVENTSKAYNKIIELNNEYQFEEFDTHWIFVKELNTKQRFDNYSLEKLLNNELEDKLDLFEDLVKKSIKNSYLFKEYEKECGKLPYVSEDNKDLKISFNKYKKIEKKIIEEIIKKPPTYFGVEIVKEYNSPKGKNYYMDSETYSYNEIVNALEKVKKDIEERKNFEYLKQIERRKLNPQLRYKVLQRDGFRCQICGAGEKDGVVLHVDHIKPISKGGKTEIDNLRTLCQTCNLGKSDSYVENGLN